MSPTHSNELNLTADEKVKEEISAMCQQLSQDLSLMTKNDDMLTSKNTEVSISKLMIFPYVLALTKFFMISDEFDSIDNPRFIRQQSERFFAVDRIENHDYQFVDVYAKVMSR